MNKYALPMLLALGCAGPGFDTFEDVADRDLSTESEELGQLEQSITVNQTLPGASGRKYIPGFMETSTHSSDQCRSNQLSTTQCVLPKTKTLNLYLSFGDATLHAWLQTIATTVRFQMSDSTWGGTNWTINVLPDGQFDSGTGGVKVIDLCYFLDPPANPLDIRSYSTYTVNGLSLPLSEALPGTFYTHDQNFEIRIDTCRIGDQVGWDSTQLERVTKHALAFNIYKAAGIGTAVNGGNNGTDPNLNPLLVKSQLPTWQKCIAKTMNVSNPSSVTLTNAFQCPAPPNGQ